MSIVFLGPGRYTADMKRRPQKDPTQEVPDLPEPDLSELERWHDPLFRERLVDALTNVAGLADARDPDATALLNAFNPPSRAVH